MTLLGKIFTVLILIMSLVFMSLSLMLFATHKNWKLAVLNPEPNEQFPYKGLKFQVQDAHAANVALRAELERMKNDVARERAARKMTIAQLQTKSDQLQIDRDAKERDLAAKLAENSQMLEELKTAQAQLVALTEQTNNLRNDVRTAQADRDAQFKQVVALSDKVHQHQGDVKRLEERRDALALQITDMKRVMDAMGLTVNTPIDNKTPTLNGLVTEVSTKNQDFIEISIGSDDGLREGHQLDVYRDNSYLGRVIVRRVDTNFAVAEIIKEYRKGNIRKGDSVTTRFS